MLGRARLFPPVGSYLNKDHLDLESMDSGQAGGRSRCESSTHRNRARRFVISYLAKCKCLDWEWGCFNLSVDQPCFGPLGVESVCSN